MIKTEYSFIKGSGNQVSESISNTSPLLAFSFFCQSGFTGTLSRKVYNSEIGNYYTLETITDKKDYYSSVSGMQYVPRYDTHYLHITGAVTGNWIFECVNGV
jgi:hypothetical protein